MKRAISQTHGGKRPGAGRPATGKDPVRTMRLSDNFIAKVDAWATQQSDAPTRTEAIRRLVELGLTKSGLPRKPQVLSTAKQAAARAAELAAKVIEKKLPTDAPPVERATRKRKLLKGPSMVRDVRKDKP